MMNRLNWIQQEQKVADYHVLTWGTSHFHHPKNRTEIAGAARSKFDGGGAAFSGMAQQTEGIGIGLTDRSKSNGWQSGGGGSEGLGSKGKETNRDMRPTVEQKVGQQNLSSDSTTACGAVVQEVYSVINSARQSVTKMYSRITKDAGRLHNLYQNRPKQVADTSDKQNKYHRPPEKEKRGTRPADKDEMLTMQAENHYLLDSYDKNGQYSMLGK